MIFNQSPSAIKKSSETALWSNGRWFDTAALEGLWQFPIAIGQAYRHRGYSPIVHFDLDGVYYGGQEVQNNINKCETLLQSLRQITDSKRGAVKTPANERTHARRGHFSVFQKLLRKPRSQCVNWCQSPPTVHWQWWAAWMDLLPSADAFPNFLMCKNEEHEERRLFRAHLEKADCSYSDLLLHTDKRWLSRGKDSRFQELCLEIRDFLLVNKNAEYTQLLSSIMKARAQRDKGLLFTYTSIFKNSFFPASGLKKKIPVHTDCFKITLSSDHMCWLSGDVKRTPKYKSWWYNLQT